MQVPSAFVGVDVSKVSLDASIAGQLGCVKLANEPSPIDAWLAQLPVGAAVAAESTGRHHQVLVERCHAARVPVYVLNARDVFFFAKALGARAKTDRLDCQVIAQYLKQNHEKLRPTLPANKAVLEIERLLHQRAVLVDKRVALREAFKDCPIQQPWQVIEQGLKAAEQALKARVNELVQADAALRQGQKLLQTITGFGEHSSAQLAALLSRLSFANSDALVAYAGLDPRANDSGDKRGRRALSKKGPPELRRTLYLVAFAACHSKLLKPTYQALKARGLKTTEAMIVLARKLLRVAFAVWKHKQPFDPSKMGLQIA